MSYKDKFIGEKQVASVSKPKDGAVTVEYADGTKEPYSALLIDKVVSEEPCDLSTLRDKRIKPIVAEVLEVLKNWGLKLSELQYLSLLLNQSIEFNQTQALLEVLDKQAGVKLLSPDDVDMLTLDSILKTVENKITLEDALNQQEQ